SRSPQPGASPLLPRLAARPAATSARQARRESATARRHDSANDERRPPVVRPPPSPAIDGHRRLSPPGPGAVPSSGEQAPPVVAQEMPPALLPQPFNAKIHLGGFAQSLCVGPVRAHDK